jgi:hypothetical protein
LVGLCRSWPGCGVMDWGGPEEPFTEPWQAASTAAVADMARILVRRIMEFPSGESLPWSRNPPAPRKFACRELSAARQLRERLPQLTQPRRLVEDAIDVGRDLIFRGEALAPARQENDRGIG